MDHSKFVSKSITAIAPPPRIMSRSALASSPIVISGRKDCTVDYSYPLSHHARELDHEELNYELNSAVAP